MKYIQKIGLHFLNKVFIYIFSYKDTNVFYLFRTFIGNIFCQAQKFFFLRKIFFFFVCLFLFFLFI